ncbi:MAG: hypothetical protein EAZ95_12850 [Bacteroidetes bacterium]|nr:MAG: hypothetical protein EAZ95_12850 [Bacteroidota bacterium]
MPKYTIFGVLTTLAFLYCFSYYLYKEYRHERLMTKGIEVKVEVKIGKAQSAGYSYIDYQFVTLDKQIKKGYCRCGSPEDCRKYEDATVVYNPENINEFEFSHELHAYSHVGAFIFMLLILFPVFTLVAWQISKALTKPIR